VNDGDGGISDETFTMTSVLDGVVPADFVPFSGNRQLSFVQPSLRNQIYQSAPSMNLDLTKNYQAVISTDEGDIVLDLFPDKAPLAVNNFVRLAQDGFYDGLTFHRVIDNFVAQGGDPRGVGNGGPGYNFTDEFDASLNFSGSGVLAMANSGPNSNGSQFFITYSPQNHLTNVHTIFGQLVSGQTALNNLARSEPLDVMRKVTILIT
jgi:cyclophilin family peptidyl-prolyl cis-trans isomerase